MTNSVSAYSVVQRLATDAVAVHGPNLISNMMVYSAVDACIVESTESGTWGTATSRSHFK